MLIEFISKFFASHLIAAAFAVSIYYVVIGECYAPQYKYMIKYLIVVLSSYVTPGPYFERTVRTSSKSLNGRKIARMAPILTIFGLNRSQRRDLFFEKFSNERRRHRGIVVVVIFAVVAAIAVVGDFR